MQPPNERVTIALNHPGPHISDFAARRELRGREYEYHPRDREYDHLGRQRHPYGSGVTHRDDHRGSHGDVYGEVSFHPSHDARPYPHEPRSEWRTGNREYRYCSREAPLDNREGESNDREPGRANTNTRGDANYSRGRDREPAHRSGFWSQSRSYALAPVQDALQKLGLRFNGVERADSFLRRVLEARSMFPDSDVEILRSISIAFSVAFFKKATVE